MRTVIVRAAMLAVVLTASAGAALGADPQAALPEQAPAARALQAEQLARASQAPRAAQVAPAQTTAELKRKLAEAKAATEGLGQAGFELFNAQRLADEQQLRSAMELDALGMRLDALAERPLSPLAARLDQESPLSRLYSERQQQSAEREEALYERGTSQIDEGRWERAASTFDEVANLKGRKADGALYWRAYSLNKLGQRDGALQTVQNLLKTYPSSRWLNDAKALEMEIRQTSGQGVSAAVAGDDELKLLALNSLMQNSDPDQVVGVLEKFLKSNRSPQLKERALFVLAQSKSPKARTLLADVAKGGSNPDLQLKAIKYLGIFGKQNGQELQSIYQSSSDPDVKHAALRALMISRDKDRVLAVAKSEQNAELRQDAIRQLGIMGGQAELWQLYGNESTVEGKEQILKSLFVGGDVDKMLEVARTEKDPRLRRVAIRNLGMMQRGNRHYTVGVSGGIGTGVGSGRGSGPAATSAGTPSSANINEALVSLYSSEQDSDNKKEIIRALFLRQDGKSLVDLARKETDPERKREIIRQMSLIRSKETTDYMMELLNK